MEDYRLDQSGQEVQNILDGAAMQVDLTAETERATDAEQTLQGNIDIEERDRKAADVTLQGNIDAEETRAKAAEKANADDIDALEAVVPSGASSSNKLTTESFVNDAVATSSATFRGTYNLVSDLHLTLDATHANIATALASAIATANNNDFAFVQIPTDVETPSVIGSIERYKFNGFTWGFEYELNNSGFTQAQWDAINSGITSENVTKLAALPTNAQLTTLLNGLQGDIDDEETRAKAAELLLQENIDAEETRAKAAEKRNADDIDAIEALIPGTASSENQMATASEVNSLSDAIEAILLLIPSAASSLNQLADKAFVSSSIATSTSTFRGTFNLVNDLHLTLAATHAQIGTALASAISDEDNNDYCFVQVPVSVMASAEIAQTDRYKFNGTTWEYEYTLNNSGFTSDQWAAINSGITSALVTKLSALPTDSEITSALGLLTSSITTINQKIPAAASQENKLVDTTGLESYIVQVLNVLTATYTVTSSDGHVTFAISQVDGKITSVTLTTLDIASAATLSLVEGRVTTAEGNISTNAADIAILQAAYRGLTQSDMIIVNGALPSSGQQQNIIYRQPDPDHTPPQFYSDYMWNGTTWVLMAQYNNAIDDEPTPGSNNLVKSGGVLNSIIQNGPAFDLSAHNAVGGVLATYDDLSAALTALSALDAAYKQPGMSIKFVQSSDNKYVQFRLMAQVFSTTPSDWQGVDKEPIPYSKNITDSGGTAKQINELMREVGTSNEINYIHSFVPKIIGSDGTVSDSTVRSTVKVKLLESATSLVLKNNGSTVTLVNAVSWYSQEPNYTDATGFLSRTSPIPNVNNIAIYENAKWAIVDLNNEILNSLTTFNVIQTPDNGLIQQVSEINKTIPSIKENFYTSVYQLGESVNYYSFLVNKSINSDGRVFPDNTKKSVAVKLIENTIKVTDIYIDGVSSAVYTISWYTEKPNFEDTTGFISRTGGSAAGTIYEIPGTAKWAIFTFNATALENKKFLNIKQGEYELTSQEIAGKLSMKEYDSLNLEDDDNYAPYICKSWNISASGVRGYFVNRHYIVVALNEATSITVNGITVISYSWWSGVPDFYSQSNFIERNQSPNIVPKAKYVVIAFTAQLNSMPTEIYVKRTLNNVLSLSNLGSFLNNSVGENCFANGVRTNLKILGYGNSFMRNSVAYLSAIAKNGCNVNLTVGNLYTGGTNLDDHLAALKNGTSPYEWHKYVDGVNTINQTGQTAMRGLTDERWDAIILHQYTPWTEPFEPTLNEFISLIISKLGYCPKFYINSTWAGHEDYVQAQYGFETEEAMWSYMLNACKGACKDSGIQLYSIIPTGTAIQNARTLSWADSYNRFTNGGTDWHHLNPAGGFIAACTVFQKIVTPLCGIQCSDTTFRITTAQAMPPSAEVQQGILVTDDNYLSMCQAAIKAVENPDVITTITES